MCNDQWNRCLAADDAVMLEHTARVLQKVSAVEVIALQDSRPALDVFFAESEAFELVVTDYEMPDVNWLELAHAVRHCMREFKDLPRVR